MERRALKPPRAHTSIPDPGARSAARLASGQPRFLPTQHRHLPAQFHSPPTQLPLSCPPSCQPATTQLPRTFSGMPSITSDMISSGSSRRGLALVTITTSDRSNAAAPICAGGMQSRGGGGA